MKLHRFNKIIFLISALICVLPFAGCKEEIIGGAEPIDFELISNSNPDAIEWSKKIPKDNEGAGEVYINASAGGKITFETSVIAEIELSIEEAELIGCDTRVKEYSNDWMKMECKGRTVTIEFLDNIELQNDGDKRLCVAAIESGTYVYIHRKK